MTALVQTTSGALAPQGSILGDQPIRRVPVSGKIRAGVKRLTRAAEKFPEAKRLYDEAVARADTDGIPVWDELEATIKKACPDLDRSPLTPVNVPRFFLRARDFRNPDNMRQILDLYAEDRGGRRGLYRFPITLWSDDWLQVMPHQFESHTASSMARWSEYHGGGRVCVERVQLDGQKDRPRRMWGGRPTKVAGPCKPNDCPHYQASRCNLKGQLLFFIPGVPAGDPFSITTGSWYSMEQWRTTLSLVLATRGRLSGTENGEPFLWVSKQRQEVSRIDPDTGKAMRTEQWLIEIESRLDISAMYAEHERQQRLALKHASGALPPPPNGDDPADGPGLVTLDESEVPF